MENKPVTTDNPFGIKAKDQDINAATVMIESERAIAEVQAMVIMARRFARDPYKAYERIMAACARSSFAESAIFAYPRGKTTVTGLTIRAAEVIALEWGNLQYGLKELGYHENETEIEAYCWDLETNVRSSQTFRIPRERFANGSVTKLVDPRDVYENNANLGARRMRSRILAIIPPDVKEAAEAACRATIAGKGDEPILKKINKMVQLYNKLGITANHLETRLGHRLDDILPEEYTELVTIYNSLKDNMTNPSDWFAVSKTAVANEAAQNVDALLSSKPDEPAKEPIKESVKESPVLASKEQLEELDSLWKMQFVNDNKAGNTWAAGMLGHPLVKKNLTESEATMLISDLEACLTPPAEDVVDGEYTDSLEL